MKLTSFFYTAVSVSASLVPTKTAKKVYQGGEDVARDFSRQRQYLKKFQAAPSSSLQLGETSECGVAIREAYKQLEPCHQVGAHSPSFIRYVESLLEPICFVPTCSVQDSLLNKIQRVCATSNADYVKYLQFYRLERENGESPVCHLVDVDEYDPSLVNQIDNSKDANLNPNHCLSVAMNAANEASIYIENYTKTNNRECGDECQETVRGLVCSECFKEIAYYLTRNAYRAEMGDSYDSFVLDVLFGAWGDKSLYKSTAKKWVKYGKETCGWSLPKRQR